MKFNWVNILATLLIVGGLVLLIERQLHTHTTRPAPTLEEAKADIERQIETKLGRPLSDAETEMIDVTKSDEKINITLHQPLTGRLMKAIHDAKAATQPGGVISTSPRDILMPPGLETAGQTPAAGATTLPGSGMP
jgi:hypothetical protein